MRVILVGALMCAGAVAQSAPSVMTVGEATKSAAVTDVVRPEKHPEAMLLGPAQMKRFYHLQGIANEGEGQTIALIGAHHDDLMEHDLAVFSERFGLPMCTVKSGCLKLIDSPGAGAAGMVPKLGADAVKHSFGEEEMDVEWAHAMAPKAHLMLVGGPTGEWANYLIAVKTAVDAGATVVSLSLAEPQRPEHKQMYLDGNKAFLDTRAVYVAAAGDHAHTARWPASSPDVVGVGGTTITTNEAGERLKEIAWTKKSNEPHATGTGGGLSLAEEEPQAQVAYGLPGDEAHMRGTPDVALYATGKMSIAVYNSNVNPKSGEAPGWHGSGGTSAGAPMWAGLLAVANSMRAEKKKVPLSKYVGKDGGKGTLAALYTVGKVKPEAFFDITEGTNGDCGAECTAGVGYDYLTGLGTPNLAVLLPALVALP